VCPEDVALELRDKFLETREGKLIDKHLANVSAPLQEIGTHDSSSPGELWDKYEHALDQFAKRFGEDGFEHSTKYLYRKVAKTALRLDKLPEQIADREDLRIGKPVKVAVGTEGGKKRRSAGRRNSDYQCRWPHTCSRQPQRGR
jgi:hypothetical protein